MKKITSYGIYTSRIIQHPEILEICKVFSSDTYLSIVGFIYNPSKVSRDRYWRKDPSTSPYKVFNERNAGPLKGSEIMGTTLIISRSDIPIRWYGAEITCEQGRQLGFDSNPTVLQVSSGILVRFLWN